MGIAFYDLDRTSIAVNSATLWVRRQWREGRLASKDMLLAGWWLSLYRLGMMRVDHALHQAVATMEGELEAELERRTRVFWLEECVHSVRPGVHRALARHSSLGHANVLSTSSSPWISRCAVQELGLEDYLCTRIEVVDGLLTGKVAGTPNFGEGKRENLVEYARARGVELADCWFYTDSSADQPVLEVVGHPVCVAPDPRLARVARQRGWPVEDWG